MTHLCCILKPSVTKTFRWWIGSEQLDRVGDGSGPVPIQKGPPGRKIRCLIPSPPSPDRSKPLHCHPNTFGTSTSQTSEATGKSWHNSSRRTRPPPPHARRKRHSSPHNGTCWWRKGGKRELNRGGTGQEAGPGVEFYWRMYTILGRCWQGHHRVGG